MVASALRVGGQALRIKRLGRFAGWVVWNRLISGNTYGRNKNSHNDGHFSEATRFTGSARLPAWLQSRPGLIPRRRPPSTAGMKMAIIMAIFKSYPFVRLARLPPISGAEAIAQILDSSLSRPASEADALVAFQQGRDIVRHPLDRRAVNQIVPADLAGDGTGTAHPDRHAQGLHGGQ